MSEPIHCDTCKTVGHRRVHCIAPDGWNYATFTTAEHGVCYLYACSMRCVQAVRWNVGPGDLRSPDDLALESTVVVEDANRTRIVQPRGDA